MSRETELASLYKESREFHNKFKRDKHRVYAVLVLLIIINIIIRIVCG